MSYGHYVRYRTLFCLVALLVPASLYARSARPAPPLAGPTGNVLKVSTEPQLQAAVAALASNTTIVIAPGTYVLTRSLYIHGSFTNVAIRGATVNSDDVVLVGPGMAQPNYGDVPYGIWTGDGVNGVTIANLTIRDFFYHPIIFNGGTQNPHVYNVHLINAGQQFIKVNPDASGVGASNGTLEYSIIEFITNAKDDYTKGIDIQAARNWVVRHNLFRNIVAPVGQIAGPGILVWRGSTDTVVEGNSFVNCARGIMFGADDTASPSHSGGIIRNNFFFRSASQPGDVGIILSDSPQSKVLSNTLVVSGTYGTPIEVRYPGTSNVLVANNLLDGTVGLRDGGTAAQSHNYVGAVSTMFVNAASGDLRLSASAFGAIDQGDTLAEVTDDWDGELRPTGNSYDIGADEGGATVVGYQIGGRITRASDGTVLAGVTVALSGARSAMTTTDSSGRYQFANLASGSDYEVTPTQSGGFVFNPASYFFSLRVDQTSGDFTAIAVGDGSASLAASPDGAIIPTTTPQIVDSTGAVWTIGSDTSIRRNGAQVGSAWGSRIYWKSSTIDAYGFDDNWWQWTGSTWINVGPSTPGADSGAPSSGLTSADGTMVPMTAPQIVDNTGAVWTIGSDTSIRRSGAQVGSAWGSKIYWRNTTIYVYGLDFNWWQWVAPWTESSWTNVGPVEP